MNRPGLVSYLIGNLFSCIGIIGITAFTGLYWLAYPSEMSPAVPAILTVLAARALKENSSIRAYRRWNAAWNDAAGTGQSEERPKKTLGVRCKQALGWLWIICAAILYLDFIPSQLGKHNDLIAFFGVLTAIIFCITVASIVRRFRRPASSGRSREHVVAVCVAVPRNSPTPSECISALPRYCSQVMGVSVKRADPP